MRQNDYHHRSYCSGSYYNVLGYHLKGGLIMKKILLIALLIVFLSGCNGFDFGAAMSTYNELNYGIPRQPKKARGYVICEQYGTGYICQ
jgi:hypothetical protein